jgi:ribosomal protein S11
VASNSTSICTVASGVVHYVGVGTCSLTASATAGTHYTTITGSAQTFVIGQTTPTISISNLPSNATYNGSFTPALTYSGDGTTSVASNSTSICTVASGVVHFVGEGICSLTASAAAGVNYAAIAGSPQVFTVSQTTPSISIGNLPSNAAYGGSFTLSIVYSGDGIASVISNSVGICTVTSGVVHFVGAGVCSLTASAAAGVNYAAAPGSPQVFTVGPAASTITFAPIVTTYAYSPSEAFALSATSTSGLSVGYASLTPAVCQVSGSTVAVVSTGTCTIQASQAATSNYSAAQSVSVNFTIAQAVQALTFAPIVSPVAYGISPITLIATGGASGNPVIFSVVSGPGLINGNTLTITGAGTVVVAANQNSSTDYSAAAQVTQTIFVLSPLALNAAGLSFENVPVGTSSPTQTLIITNPNGSTATMASIAASGEFAAASNCPTIAPYSNCSVNITFAPRAAGVRTGSLTIASSTPWSLQSVPLTGTGTVPGIQVSTASLSFGSQAVSTTSAGQSITILNTGTASLVISNVATTGDFAVNNNCSIVPAGSNCSIAVTFTPSATGVRAGTITLTDNGGSNSQVIGLSGMGAMAGASLSSSALTFPGTLIGATSFEVNTTLTNSGAAQLTGIGVAAVGDFTETNTCGAPLDPGASCTISVKYTPTVAGFESGTLVVTDNLGTQTAALLGAGLSPGASLSTSQLVFGGQLPSTTSLAQTVVFTNSGSGAVTINSVTPSANFADTTNCAGSIAPGASCSVNVFFAPTATGSLGGTVAIADTAGTQIITTQGQGVSAGLSVAPSFGIFGAQVVGSTSLAQTLTVTNTGPSALTLNPITVSSNFTESDQCPTTLPAGAFCKISVSFAPTATGSLSGSVAIGDTTGTVSTLATVRGQGTMPGIAASPSTLFFGSLAVGATSQAQTVTVSNTGSAPLQVGTIAGSGDFAEADNCASSSVAAGSYCVISVTMNPTTVGMRTGTIQINNSVDGVHEIALSGMGQQAGVNIYPTSMAFGSFPYDPSGVVSLAGGTPLTVTIANTGNIPLQLSGIGILGDFAEINNCGSTVAVGKSCTLIVNFVPTALGHRTGTLTITDNAGGGTQLVALEGDGSPVGLTLTPPVLNFGAQALNVTSRAQTATLTNNTGQTISNISITASGEYSESDNCGNTIANQTSCTLSISVTPVTTGAITGRVGISGAVGANASPDVRSANTRNETASTSSDSNVGVIAVSASAIPGGLGLSSSQLSFTATSVGTLSTGETITIQNTSASASLTSLTISETNAAEFPMATNCPATLSAQATCTVTIQFGPLAAGLRASTLDITASGGITAAIPLSGTATKATPAIAWTQPAPILYGTPLSNAQLSASVSGIAGTYAYSPAAGIVPSAGAQTLSVTFTPNDITDYNIATQTVPLTVIDYALNTTGSATQTVLPGAAASYTLAIVPTSGPSLPASTMLTVTGLPAGATVTIAPSTWTQLTGTSWSLPANTSFASIAMSITTAATATSRNESPSSKMPPVLWGILLLPFAGKMRRVGKRLGKTASLLLLLAASVAAVAGISGCGGGSGFFGHSQQATTVTVTATAGTLSRSTEVTLNVQ